jgi:hypothetical protein
MHTPDPSWSSDPHSLAGVGQVANPSYRHRGIHAEDFRQGFGEDLQAVLDLETWRAGRDLGSEYERLQREVELAARLESEVARRVRQEVFPDLRLDARAPCGAGHHIVASEEIQNTWQGLLFNGSVEAVDGLSEIHDSLALTIHQIGVGLVSYAGNQGTWQQRLYRRDLVLGRPDPVAEMIEQLRSRQRSRGAKPGGEGSEELRDELSELARRALLSYGVRAVLVHKATAPWRVGYGSPMPRELLSGGGSTDLMLASLHLVRELVLEHQRFAFVGREESDRLLLRIGMALRPLEYVIVSTLRPVIEDALYHWCPTAPASVDTTWEGERLTPEQWVRRFRDEVAHKVIVGVYKPTLLAPARVFYAHVDHAHLAARVILADGALQELTGFPLLLEMARQVCQSVYGEGSLRALASAAWLAARTPSVEQKTDS